MGSYYKRQCYPTATDYHQAVASDCPTVSQDGGYLIQCSPSESKIVLSRTDVNTLVTTTTDYTPGQIACDPDQQLSDGIALAWLVVGVWVAAWCVRQIVNVIRI